MKLNLDKIKKLGKSRLVYKLLITLANHFVLTSLALLLLIAFLSFLVFYKYVLLSERIEIEVLSQKSIFEEELYKKVLKIWEEQDKKFNEADNKEYINPFKIQQSLEQKPEKP